MFEMLEGSHRIVSVDPVSPCTASSKYETFDSGLQAVANGTTEGSGPSFSFTVTNVSLATGLQ